MTPHKQDIHEVLWNLDMSSNELIGYFQIVNTLIKKYGKRLLSPKIINIVQQADPNVYGLLLILIHHKKNKTIAIQNIIKQLKTNADYIPNFEVHMIEDSHKHSIQDKIKERFPWSVVHVHHNIDLWVSVSGEWWHYKRNIDQDLKKILW